MPYFQIKTGLAAFDSLGQRKCHIVKIQKSIRDFITVTQKKNSFQRKENRKFFNANIAK